MQSSLVLRATHVSLFVVLGACASGPRHAAAPVGGTVTAMPSDAASAPTNDELIVDGETLYQKKGCIACHSINGELRVGPSWRGIYGSTQTMQDGRSVVVDDAFIKQSIETPSAAILAGFPEVMPSFAAQLSQKELRALTVYIKSLAAP